MARPENFTYKGYSAEWSEYTGAYAIYKIGATMNRDYKKNEEAVKRQIDKWEKEGTL